MQPMIRQLISPVLITAAVLAAPLLSEPFGFATALAAVLLGPGGGLAAILFPHGHLSVPERLAVVVMGSITVVVGVLAALNTLRIPLTASVVGALVLATTWVFALGAALVRRRAAPTIPALDDPDWMLFSIGCIVALACAFGLRALIG